MSKEYDRLQKQQERRQRVWDAQQDKVISEARIGGRLVSDIARELVQSAEAEARRHERYIDEARAISDRIEQDELENLKQNAPVLYKRRMELKEKLSQNKR